MNRRDLLRNTLLTIGVAAVNRPALAREFAPDYDASVALARPDWTPVFLDVHQNETLIALSDAIIPATDTPGAKAAFVNRFLDLLLSSEPLPTQHAFLASLAYLDMEAIKKYKAPFLRLSPEEKNDFLSLLAYPHTQARWGVTETDFTGYTHFSKLKGWISKAFYSSPAGLKELGWDGSPPGGIFTGCEHSPDEHAGSA